MIDRWDAKRQAETLENMMRPEASHHKFSDETQKGYSRLPLQRDRDRIVWSKSFKRLGYKTQVFPHLYTDHHRYRLTHSLEVMQLATSIARSLGLNAILCEAIAFAHDLGHTPFGHVGESAIDNALQCIKFEGMDAAVCGLSRFSHYEQGVDIVRYIDSDDPENRADGLHVDPLIAEGILKHTYDHTGSAEKYKSLAFLAKHTKYRDLIEGQGTLEAQVVRICDKISYFISDIEDGLIIEVLHLDQLSPWKDNLFQPVFDAASKPSRGSDDDYRVFRSTRDKVLSNIIESVLRHDVSDPSNIIRIEPEPDIKKQLQNVYLNLQKNMYEQHIVLLRASHRARHIVSCLFCQYLRHPELIPWRYRRRYHIANGNAYHEKLRSLYLRDNNSDLLAKVTCDLTSWHTTLDEKEDTGCSWRLKIKRASDRTVSDIICVKDWVAGMTDNFAEVRYSNDVDCPESHKAWQVFEMGKTFYCETSTIS